METLAGWQPISPTRQQGAIALAVGMTLLLLGTIGTLYVTRITATDQRISANVVRAKTAFEAAEAGINFAIAFLDVDSRDLNGDDIDDRTGMLTVLGITGNDDINDNQGQELDDCDSDGNSLCSDSEAASGKGYRLQAVWDASNAGFAWGAPTQSDACDTLVSENPVRVCVLMQVTDDPTRVRLTATGYSDDRQSVKQIARHVRRISPFPMRLNPTHPLITYGGVSINGSMQVVNLFSNATIWAGADLSSLGSGNNSGTLIHPDPNGPTLDRSGADSVPFRDENDNQSMDEDEGLLDYAKTNPYRPGALTQASRNINGKPVLGFDITDNSSDLHCDKDIDPNCFFNLFVAGPPDLVKLAADSVIDSDQYDQLEELSVGGGYIWVDARGDGSMTDFALKNGTYGSADAPIVLVVDGNFDPQGAPTVYGVVFVRGDVVGGGSGGGLIIGSLIVEGDDGLDNAGGMDIIYDPNIVARSGGGAGRTLVAPIAGTWRDWQ